MFCQYCKKEAKFVKGNDIYPHRPDLSHLKFYQCKSCDAYVGCNKATGKPLGTLANSELRRLRSDAHNSFDPLWKSGFISRSDAYQWLADKLGIKKDKCHIAMFDNEMCLKVIDSCKHLSAEYGI